MIFGEDTSRVLDAIPISLCHLSSIIYFWTIIGSNYKIKLDLILTEIKNKNVHFFAAVIRKTTENYEEIGAEKC
jgi:hypothetical protein